MLKRASFLLAGALAAAAMLASLPAAASPIISAGTPTTSVPTYLTDGSYPFGITVTLGTDQFLLPVNITGAATLQAWQFDLTFDASVVQEVDPFDGSAGIYGAAFTPGNPTSLSFILGGFPLNVLGSVDGVAGSYPSLLDGPTGNGPLAYILFEYIPGQEQNDPTFAIANPSTMEPVPEPSSLALLAAGAIGLLGARHRMRRAGERRFA
jgi:PEP-CTERM motif